MDLPIGTGPVPTGWDLSIRDLWPHLSKRGRLEVHLAYGRHGMLVRDAEVTRLSALLAESEARLGATPPDDPEPPGADDD